MLHLQLAWDDHAGCRGSWRGRGPLSDYTNLIPDKWVSERDIPPVNGFALPTVVFYFEMVLYPPADAAPSSARSSTSTARSSSGTARSSSGSLSVVVSIIQQHQGEVASLTLRSRASPAPHTSPAPEALRHCHNDGPLRRPLPECI